MAATPSGRRAVVLAALAAALWGCDTSHGPPPLHAFGTIEARQIEIASRFGGRIRAVLVDEDDQVRRGDPLVRFDLSDVQAQRREASAALDAATARLDLLVHGAQKEDLDVARHAVEAARSRVREAERERARSHQLVASHAAPQQRLDTATYQAQTARADLAARVAQLKKLAGGTRPEELAAAEAARDQAQAALALVDDRLTDEELRAPLDAFVLHRIAEPGEVARAAGPLLVLGDLGHPYLDVYVAEAQLGAARHGATATVTVDAWPGRTFTGVVSRVAGEAEFTPKNVETADQRARLVYRTRVELEDPEHLLRPGMPGEARFLAPDAGVTPGRPSALR